jgi:hypothetical protein
MAVAGSLHAADAPTARAPDGAERLSIGEYIREHAKPLQDCYDQRLSAEAARKNNAESTLHGKLIIRFDIRDDGTVSDATASGISDRPLVDCVVSATSTWQFAKPAGGGRLRVAYPITFTAD